MADVILSVLAHPDDAEFLCAGTLIRLARERGWRVHIASMTPGDCGSAELGPDDIARVRRAEGAAAAGQINAAYHCLERRDLRVMYDEPTLAAVTRLLRRVQPRIVLTHSPSDYMLDHEMTSTVARAATFAAPIPNYLPGEGPPLPAIPHLYYCDPTECKDLFGRPVPPQFSIDISAVIDAKELMLACHASQRNWLLRQHGIDEYLESQAGWGARRGAEIGVAQGEGFRQYLGHPYPHDNRLLELLGLKA